MHKIPWYMYFLLPFGSTSYAYNVTPDGITMYMKIKKLFGKFYVVETGTAWRKTEGLQ